MKSLMFMEPMVGLCVYVKRITKRFCSPKYKTKSKSSRVYYMPMTHGFLEKASFSLIGKWLEK